jgi:4-amino-4-deoxy-L-arabinose transferase-like glycosyltransferase
MNAWVSRGLDWGRRCILPSLREHWLDALLTWGLGLGYLVVLLLTAPQLGYSRDEGFYFQAANEYGRWFDILLSDPQTAIQKATVNRYWNANHEHPALIKSLFWASHEWLRGWPLIGDHGTAYRFPAMVLSAVCVSVIYAWGRRLISGTEGRLLGLIAALTFAFLPQVFYHAHLACFDMPVTAMWVITTYAYWRSTLKASWSWPIATALLYGLLLNTKHNSWILPGALFLHLVGDRVLGFRGVRLTRLGVPASWFTTLLIAPLVFVGTWPWIWFNTYKRLEEYVEFHTGHVYYNMEFLGQTYFKAPMPRLYPWVMTVATVPTITVALFLMALVVYWQMGLWPGLLWRGRWLKQRVTALTAWLRRRKDVTSSETPDPPFDGEQRRALSTLLLWATCILASYAPWVSKKAPIFGGTKHWLTAYPFLCLFAAFALVVVLRVARDLPLAARLRNVASGIAAALVVAVPVVIAFGAHPWGLAAYVPVVGGAPGAASLGLNRSFWGYTTASVAPYLNENAPKGARVFIHDTAVQSWQMMAKDKMLRKDLQPWYSVHGSQWAVYHHEQHMSRVEFMAWVDYGTVTPAHIGSYDGVPIVWLYQRPEAPLAGAASEPGTPAELDPSDQSDD